MAAINWALYTEAPVGRGHPTLSDVVNRPLRQLMTASGMDPDADAGAGFAKAVHTHISADITDLATASTNITKVGTVVTGIWTATVIAAAYLGAHTHPWSQVTATPTTVAGYAISDVYTQAQVNTLLGGKAPVATTLAGYGITDGLANSGAIAGSVNFGQAGGTFAKRTLTGGSSISITENVGAATLTIAVTTVPWGSVTSAPTTLAGYGIANAYTTAQVDGFLAGKANAATTLAGYGIANAYTTAQVDGFLAALSASNLTTGTIPAGRFPGTLPAFTSSAVTTPSLIATGSPWFDPMGYAAIGNGIADDTTAVNNAIAAAAAVTPVGLVYLAPNLTFLVTTLTNTNGVRFEGPGRIITAISGGTQQLTSSADRNQHVFGLEYLAAFQQRLIDGLPCGIVITGDSTVFGSFTVTGYAPDAILARLATATGATNQTFYNRGQSGQNSTAWRSTYLSGDLTAVSGGPPHLLIVHWGMNDQSGTVAAFTSSMRTALTTIRASYSAAALSILLMPPNACSGTSSGRDEKWTEAIRAPLRQMARDFQCCYYDTAARYLDARAMKGIAWNDDTGTSGGSVHPLSVLNAQIWTDVAELVYRRGLASLTGVARTTATVTPGSGWTVHDVDTRHVTMGRSGFATAVTTPDSVPLRLTADPDVIVLVAADSYTLGRIQILASQLHVAGNYGWDFFIGATGIPAYRFSNNGTAVTQINATVACGATDGTQRYFRFTQVLTSGDVKFYLSAAPVARSGTLTISGGAGAGVFSISQAGLLAVGDLIRDNATGIDYRVLVFNGTTGVTLDRALNGTITSFSSLTWTQLGTTITGSGAVTLFNSTDHLELGSSQNGTGLPLVGNLYRCDICNGINSSAVATFNPAASAVSGNTSFIATTGETWTITGGTVFEALCRVSRAPDGTVRMTGNLKGGTLTAATVIATLPATYRPTDTAYFCCPTDTTPASIYVTAGGALTIQSCPSNGLLALDGIQFLASS